MRVRSAAKKPIEPTAGKFRPKSTNLAEQHEEADADRETAGDPRVKVVFVKKPTKMVTLDDPAASLQAARGAFARLRPPEALSPTETQSWADSVRAIAKAVRVLPTRRAAALSTSTRMDVGMPTGTIREEIDALIREADDLDLFTLNEEILAEVDRG